MSFSKVYINGKSLTISELDATQLSEIKVIQERTKRLEYKRKMEAKTGVNHDKGSVNDFIDRNLQAINNISQRHTRILSFCRRMYMGGYSLDDCLNHVHKLDIDYSETKLLKCVNDSYKTVINS